MLERTESDSRRMIELAKQGVASDQDRVQAESNLKAQLATVQSLKEQVSRSAGRSEYCPRQYSTRRTRLPARSNPLALNWRTLRLNSKEAEVRLGYTKIYAPVNGTVSVRAAREGEVLTAGQPIVTIMDLGDTWVRAAIPETESDHIALGDTLRIRLPGGTVTSGKVFFKSPEADFATQRDVSRRKRDIRTIVLKVRLDNPRSAYVPGMTAEVLVSPDQLSLRSNQASTADKQQ